MIRHFLLVASLRLALASIESVVAPATEQQVVPPAAVAEQPEIEASSEETAATLPQVGEAAIPVEAKNTAASVVEDVKEPMTNIAEADAKDTTLDEESKGKKNKTKVAPRPVYPSDEEVEKAEASKVWPWPQGVPHESPEGIVLQIAMVFYEQLHNIKYQWVNPLVAFLFGGVMVVNGEVCFKWLLATSMFLCVAVLTMADLGKVWPGGDYPVIHNIVAIEAGLLAGYATLKGIHGVVVVLGAGIGAAIAYSVQSTLSDGALSDEKFIKTAWWLLSLYTVCIMTSVWFFQRKLCKTLAVISALAGSALVVSAALWAITELVVHGKLYLGPSLSPLQGFWVDFLRYLVNCNIEDRGLFAHSRHDFNIFGAHFSTDRILGFVLWFVVFLAGLEVQLKIMPWSGSKPAKKIVEARGLRARLLPK